MARKKIKTRAKRRTGLAAIPLENFEKCRYHFFEEIDPKDRTKIIKEYIKDNLPKEKSKKLLSLSDDYFRSSDVAATIFWYNAELEKTEDWQYAFNYLDSYFDNRMNSVVKVEKVEKPSAEVISVSERLAQKVNNTIIIEIDKLYDGWITGNEYEIDLYNAFKVNGLKGQATKQVKDWIEPDYLELKAAVEKTDDFMVETYADLSTKEKKRRLKIFETMFEDLERIRNTSIMQRRVRKQTVRSADKQVSKMNYKNADSDFKLESINPVLIVGSHRLYTFNTKYKVLTIFVATDVGFEVSGSTIKNFNPTASFKITLRKPEEMLPIVLGRADKTIDEAVGKLTTKKQPANGRINNDTILLRAI